MKQLRTRIIFQQKKFTLRRLILTPMMQPRLGNGKKALTDAVACKSMRPGWSKACYREGAAQMLLKDYEKACGAFLDGLKLEPENVEIESALWKAVESLKISRNNEKE